jgi:mRNA interferase MazF
MVSYVPDRGDIVWLEFDPQAGNEIKKRRPAVVLSPKKYNSKTNLAIFMPITSQIKGYPFECTFELKEIKGAILSDQIRPLDWKARKAKLITKAPADALQEAVEKFSLLLYG